VLTVSRTLRGPSRPYPVLAQLHARPARRCSPARIDSVTADSRGARCIRHEWLPFDERIRIFLKLEMAFLLSRTADIRLMMPT
jgi:hypothetical protein